MSVIRALSWFRRCFGHRARWHPLWVQWLGRRSLTTWANLCFRCSRRFWCAGLASAGVFLWAEWVAIAADLETIRDRGYLIVGVKDTVRPLGFRDEAGQLQGLEIDLAHQLAADVLGDREAIELVPLTNEERLSAVYDTVDVTIAQVSINESRERLVQFSLPYWLDGTAILTRDYCPSETANCDENPSIADLETSAIAVLRGSDAIAAVRWQFPLARLIGVESYQAALAQLEAGTADAFAGSRSVAIGWTQDYPGYRVLPDYLTLRSLAIVLPKGVQHDSLRQAVNQSLETWRTNGWLADRLDAWGLTNIVSEPES